MKIRLSLYLTIAPLFLTSFPAHASGEHQRRSSHCEELLSALRAEELHPSSQYWEIDADKSEAMSAAITLSTTPHDRVRFESHQASPLDEVLAAQVLRERSEPALIGQAQYIERHFSPRVFEYLRQHPDEPIVIAPGNIDEVASFARGGGASRLHVLPKNSLTDFTVFLAEGEKGHHTVYVQVLPGRSATFEAVSNLLHYRADYDFVIAPDRVTLLQPLHLAPTKIADILKKHHAANVDAVFFGYSSNLQKVVAEMGGSTLSEINEVELFARVLEIGDKKILSIPVTPYAFGDRAGDVLRGLNRAFAKKRLIVMVGIAGALKPEIQIDDYVVPDLFCRAKHGVTVPNLAMGLGLPAHRGLQVESVDSILQESRLWLDRTLAAKGSIVEQEGFDLVKTAIELRYPFAAVYRVSDRVGLGSDDYNNVEFSYQPDEKLSGWQRAMVELVQSTTP